MTNPTVGLWRNNPATPEGKYLVLRRDGTVPEWDYFVLGSRDPAAAEGLRYYAFECMRLNMAKDYVCDVGRLSDKWLADSVPVIDKPVKVGDPDKGPHRKDHQLTISLMRGETTMAQISENIAKLIERAENAEALVKAALARLVELNKLDARIAPNELNVLTGELTSLVMDRARGLGLQA